MNTLKEKQRLKIRFRRLKQRLRKSNKYYNFYLFFIGIIFFFFNPIKKYLLYREKNGKGKGLISYSIFDIFGWKSGYIDDFVVSRGLRGKGVGKHLFEKVLHKIKNTGCSHAFLLGNTSRKASIGLYKKFGFTVFSIGFMIVAFKKIKKER